ATCATSNTASSNKVVITITTTVVPSITITTSSDTSCAGSPVSFTATAVNGGTGPVFAWYVDGIHTGSNSNTFTTSALVNHDSIWCILTSDANCVSPNTATSNKVVMTINPIVVPSVTITGS